MKPTSFLPFVAALASLDGWGGYGGNSFYRSGPRSGGFGTPRSAKSKAARKASKKARKRNR